MNNITYIIYKRAMTLTEVIVALALLAVVALPIAASFSTGNRGMIVSAEDLVIHAAAMELMEQILAAPFEAVPTGSFNNTQILDGAQMAPNCPLRFHISDVPDIERSLTITDISKNGKVRFKKITTTVVSKALNSAGNQRSVTLKALSAKGD